MDIKKQTLSEVPKLSISKKLFKNQLNEILRIKNWIKQIKDKNCKELFFCAYLCSLDKENYFNPNEDNISDWFGGAPDWLKRS